MDMKKCTHYADLYGRCIDCGKSWAERAAERKPGPWVCANCGFDPGDDRERAIAHWPECGGESDYP